MKTIAVINQKGGVGKTTTVVNLGAAVAARGHDVCLLDLDPQSHMTLHLGIEPGSRELSLYDVLIEQASVRSTLVPAGEHLWVAPAEIDLAAAEVELVGVVGREQVLRDRLAVEALPCEFTIIDCPPSLGLLTLNALAAADEILVPLQPHFFALQGLGKLLETVQLVQKRINPKLRVAGVILCMFESNAKLSSEVLSELHTFFAAAKGTGTPWSNTKIFTTCIRRNVKLAESPSYGKSIFAYEPHSNGAKDYEALAAEFLELFGAAKPVLGDSAAITQAAVPATAVPAVVPVPPPGSDASMASVPVQS